MQRAFLFLAVLWLAGHSGIAGDTRTATRVTRDTRVTITTAAFRGAKHTRLYYGHDNMRATPERVVSSLRIDMRGKPYFMPPELVAGLGELLLYPRSFTAQQTGQHLLIRLRGGDGAGSYTCDWHVDLSRRVVARSVAGIMGSDRSESGPQPLATKASNQAMQRTAPRSVFSPRVATTVTLQPRARSGAVADLVSR
jgi:hypothetical protein